MSGPLCGRTAVVTGGTSGIGAAAAHSLAKAGATVVTGARSGSDSAAPAGATGIEADVLDVCDARSLEAFFDRVITRHGGADILVTAAGRCIEAPVAALSDAQWEEEIATHLTGTFRCIRACLPGMMARSWGRIVTFASDIACGGSADYPAYAAAKAGVISLTRSAGLTAARHQVTANVISPGWVDTPMARDALAGTAFAASDGARRTALETLMPGGRLIAPAEVAALVLYLCTDAAASVTMQDIVIDGGARWYLDRIAEAPR